MGRWRFEEYKPELSMFALQWIYAINALLAKSVLTQGMNPMVYTVYRQAMATLVLAPITLLKRRSLFLSFSLFLHKAIYLSM